jgi:hypothetical protein
MGRDLDYTEDVPTPSSPNVVPDFAHHDGYVVLYCTGAKRQHDAAVLVV